MFEKGGGSMEGPSLARNIPNGEGCPSSGKRQASSFEGLSLRDLWGRNDSPLKNEGKG